ncbi:hypothetical protein RsTz2092_12940 [Deferribacterales bacterium RsTz2092]|nr:hypothetical protein AGMMS49941_12240 [Deferribacterales bacterium]
MRQIAHWCNDARHRALITEFCSQERIEPVDFRETSEISGQCAVFITDDKAKLQEFASLDIHRCLIGDERLNHAYFTINKHFSFRSLRLLLNNIYHGTIIWNVTDGVMLDSFRHDVVTGNRYYDVEQIVCQLTVELLAYCSFADVETIRLGFSEMLTNAIEHGNLAITEEEKFAHTEAGDYLQFVDERLKDPRYIGRKVYITMEFKELELTLTIRDDGDGFDAKNVQSRPQDNLLLLYGRGIIIAKSFFDEVTHSEKGNVVTLRKKF